MTELADLAIKLDVSDRTLRRAAERGTIRCVRRSPRRLEVPVSEELYLLSRWEAIHSLVGELRTLPNVRLAVLYGSVARGDERDQSDLDLLVDFNKPGIAARSQAIGRLEDAVGRDVQLVERRDAPALLLVDVLRDGRVLVDRDDAWPRLIANSASVISDAALEREALDDELATGLAELFAEVGA